MLIGLIFGGVATGIFLLIIHYAIEMDNLEEKGRSEREDV